MKHFVDHASLRRLILSNLLVALVCWLNGQEIAMGTWRTHFSYNSAQQLVKTSNKVFCSTENGLFSRDIDSGETRKLSKIDGLSDVGVTAMAFNEAQNVLVIGYASGFVDFVYETEILSLDDLADSNLDIDKAIYDIAFGPSETYIGTDIGILVVNTSNAVIKENYVNIGGGGKQVPVLKIVYKDESLTIRTTEGIQSGSLNQNLLDFNNWNQYPDSETYSNLIATNEEVFATTDENLLILNGGEWTDTGTDLPAGASKLLKDENAVYTATSNGSIYQLSDGVFDLFFSTSNEQVNDIAQVGSSFLLADGNNGLVNAEDVSLSPDGPVSDQFSNFRVIDGEVYGFHAPSPFSYDGSAQQQFYSVFSEGVWEARTIEGFKNISDAVSFNSTMFYSSIGDGLYNQGSQETIKDIPGSDPELDTVITALASDNKLWVSSFRKNDPIHIFDQETWVSLSESRLFDNDFLTIDLSLNGIAWMGSASGTITVVDLEENQTDLISGLDGLPSSFIDIDIGVEDNAWVATSGGPALFPDGSFIFFSSEALLPTFENRLLFDGEQINAVMTDGGNRIWFGTNNGIWVYDENTSEQVAVFNVRNSPLPSNRIIQLAYNGENGEVFVYTDKGMVSFRSSSSFGGRIHANVNIFPNPVRPDYHGLIGLTGLASNVSVKVTDLNGNLVKELEANGGSTSWDLLNARGGRVATGIYLFFSATSDGEETYVGKIAVIR